MKHVSLNKNLFGFSTIALFFLFVLGISKNGNAQYCAITATSNTYGFIENVQFAGINQTSPGPATCSQQYTDYTTVVANVNLSSTYPFSTYVNSCTGTFAYGVYVTVYIDWNQNGSFTDPGEQVLGLSGNYFQTLSGNITVPAAAIGGNTRMRVIAVESGSSPQNPCTNFTWGEVEDYTVNVITAPCTAPPTGGVATSTDTANICPFNNFILGVTGQSTGSGLSFQWQRSTNGATFTDIAGATGTSYAVSGQQQSTHYRIRLICTGDTAFSTPVFVEQSNVCPIQVGTGTASAGLLPINSCWGYNLSQQIYYQSEINQPGRIEKIRFYFNGGITTFTNVDQWTVYLGHTTKTVFANTNDWEPFSGMTQVFSGTVTYPAQGNWMDIELTNPFIYNNSDNLVIGVHETSPGWSCTAQWGTFTPGGNRGMVFYNDNTNPNPLSPPTANSGLLSAIPRIQLQIREQFDAAAGSIVSPGLPNCMDNDVYIRIKNTGWDTLTSVILNWSVNGGLQTAIAFSGQILGDSLSAPIYLGNYNFSMLDTLKVWTSDPNGIPDPNSDSDTLWYVIPTHQRVDLPSTFNICFQDSGLLDAQMTSSMFEWNTGDSTQTVMITAPGVYSVTALDDLTGCISSDEVTVTESQPVTFNDTTKFCEGGAATLEVNIQGNYIWSTGSSASLIQVSTSGTYSVTLTDLFSCVSSATTEVVEVLNPIADFEVRPKFLTQVFISTAQNATDYFWDFGDGKTGMGDSIIHIYDWPGGNFNVKHWVTNECSSDTILINVQADMTTGINPSNENDFESYVYPNPNNGSFTIEFKGSTNEATTIKIFDLQGRIILEKNIGNINNQHTENIQLNDVAKGIYMLKIGNQTNGTRIVVK